MRKKTKITKKLYLPDPVVERLSRYLQCSEVLLNKSRAYITSIEFSQTLGFTDAQIRKDFSLLGRLGTKGKGYDLKILKNKIKEVLKVYIKKQVIIIGAGNLGVALTGHKQLIQHNFIIKALFDNDSKKIGKTFNNIPVKPMKELSDFIKKEDISIAIITVPPDASRRVFEMLTKTDIKGVLNLTPTTINSTESIIVYSIDITQGLDFISYRLFYR